VRGPKPVLLVRPDEVLRTDAIGPDFSRPQDTGENSHELTRKRISENSWLKSHREHRELTAEDRRQTMDDGHTSFYTKEFKPHIFARFMKYAGQSQLDTTGFFAAFFDKLRTYWRQPLTKRSGYS